MWETRRLEELSTGCCEGIVEGKIDKHVLVVFSRPTL